MKKLLTLTLAALMAFSLTSCSSITFDDSQKLYDAANSLDASHIKAIIKQINHNDKALFKKADVMSFVSTEMPYGNNDVYAKQGNTWYKVSMSDWGCDRSTYMFNYSDVTVAPNYGKIHKANQMFLRGNKIAVFDTTDKGSSDITVYVIKNNTLSFYYDVYVETTGLTNAEAVKTARKEAKQLVSLTDSQLDGFRSRNSQFMSYSQWTYGKTLFGITKEQVVKVAKTSPKKYKYYAPIMARSYLLYSLETNEFYIDNSSNNLITSLAGKAVTDLTCFALD
jgi:hypothetical protein